MKLLKKICLLGLLAALPVFAQTNSGITRITNTSVIDSGAHCWESAAGAGADVCIVRSASGQLTVTLGDGVTAGAISLGSPTLGIANAAATGTTVNTLTKITGAPSTAVIAGTGDNKNGAVIGVTVSGAGTTGTAQITLVGSVACLFDATAVTAGDFVTVSTTTAGSCHDAGSTAPVDGSQVVGRALVTGAGSANRLIFVVAGVDLSLTAAPTVTSLTSATANAAAAGLIRAATTDTINFRNAANSADCAFADTGVAAAGNGNLADVIKVGTSTTCGLQAFAFVDLSAALPANTGFIRANNNTSINWRNAANGADIGLTVNAANNLVFNGTAPTDGYYFVPLGACGLTLTTGTWAANVAGGTSIGAGPFITKAASGNSVLMGTTTAATNTFELECDLTPPTRITSAKGITVNDVEYAFNYRTTALTSIGTAAINTVTYGAAGAAAAGTVASAGGALTVTAGTSHGTPGATNASGTCYVEKLAFGTPFAAINDNQRLTLTATFLQSAAASTIIEICGVIVHYSNINSL